MLNYIWLALIVVAIATAGLLGRVDVVTKAAFDWAKIAVMTIALPLTGALCLWLGLMRIVERSGLIRIIAHIMQPIMRRLFPEVPPEHPAMGAMIMNMSANFLGLGNAATPLGLKAMSHLERLNPHPGTATNAMCLFLAINTSSITLIPTTAIAMLAAKGAVRPEAIIGPAIFATACSTIAAITAVFFFRRIWPSPLPEADAAGREDAADKESEEKDKDVLQIVKNPASWQLTLVLFLVLAAVFGGFGYLLMEPDWHRELLESTGLAKALGGEEAAEAGKAGQAEENAFVSVIKMVSRLAIPFILCFFLLHALLSRVKVYEEFVEGAKEGFQVVVRIIPFLVAMLIAMGIFRESGALALLGKLLEPVLKFVGVPIDILPMALMRPLSGGGSSGILGSIIGAHGGDHPISLTAATMFGSTETTFYVLAVYFGSVAIRRTRYALAAGLLADFVGIVSAIVICKVMFGLSYAG